MTAFVPPARHELTDPALQRPDWTKPTARDPRLLWLDKNENDDPALAAITTRVLREIDPRSVAIYPDCTPLYLKLAEWVGVDAGRLILAPGSDGVINSTFRAFIAPGDPVIHTDPTYAMYPVYARMSGAKTITVPYQQAEGGPSLSVDALNRAIRDARPKLICLPNPDSPTGTVLQVDALRSVFNTALEVGALIQVDEAYHPFYPHSVVDLVKDYPNLIVVRTFSKAWGLTGIRLGYGVASPAVNAFLHKVRPSFEINQVAVEMGVRMLTDFQGEMRASVQRLNQGRETFHAAMKELGLRTLVSHGNYSHVAFDKHGDAVHAALANLAIYRKDLGDPALKGFSRFTATTPERIQPVIETIRRVVLKSRGS
jgi:histidinol-phosphate aminotransferase